MNTLSKKILTTLAYYDVLDYPLTSFEIWKCLMRSKNREESNKPEDRVDLTDIIKTLEDEESRKYLEEYRGYYLLKGRGSLVPRRIERNKISEAKFKIVERLAVFLKFCPFVRAIAITGRLAMKNAGPKSDLDFFIILKEGRIFTGRFLVTAVAHLLGRRRWGNKIADRACLNFFVTTGSLEVPMKDLFSAHEYSFITPVFGGEWFHKFQEANSWIAGYHPNYEPEGIVNIKCQADSLASLVVRSISEKMLDWNFMENFMRRWQLERIKNNPLTDQSGSAVSASDKALVFLPEPQGPSIFERFQEKLRETGILSTP